MADALVAKVNAADSKMAAVRVLKGHFEKNGKLPVKEVAGTFSKSKFTSKDPKKDYNLVSNYLSVIRKESTKGGSAHGRTAGHETGTGTRKPNMPGSLVGNGRTKGQLVGNGILPPAAAIEKTQQLASQVGGMKNLRDLVELLAK